MNAGKCEMRTRQGLDTIRVRVRARVQVRVGLQETFHITMRGAVPGPEAADGDLQGIKNINKMPAVSQPSNYHPPTGS